MSEEQSDSPAFRLRPRRAEPKSYYTVRLEYSANPAAFTREKPTLVGAKRKAPSQRSSTSATTYSRTKQTKTGKYNHGPSMQTTTLPTQAAKNNAVPTKEDLEREYRRKQLQRDIAESITEGTIISPFMQRIEVEELKPNSTYEQNYITLRIKNVEQITEKKHLVCKCHSIDGDSDTARLYIKVILYDDYASTSLLKSEKIINIGKFRTGSKTAPVKFENNDERVAGNPGGDLIGDSSSEISKNDWIGFDVIVKYDEQLKTDGSRPLIPFVSITDMIETPTEPFVEMPPPSPPSATQQKVPNLPKRLDTNRRLGEASNESRQQQQQQQQQRPTDDDDEDSDTDDDVDGKTGECNDVGSLNQ